MKAAPRFVYLLCFIGLGIVAALALNQAVQPSMATILVRTVFMAAICAAPGLIYRKLWPLALMLLAVGCYLLIRTIMPVPTLVEGFVEQFRFYTEKLAVGASAYNAAVFPLDLMDSPELQLLLAFAVYWLMGAAAFLALSLRRPVPAVVLVLILLGYSLTVDSASRVLWPALLFVVLTACLFVLSRGVARAGCRPRDVVAGGLVGAVASALAFTLLFTVPSVAADPWQDWRSWDPFNRGGSIYSFNWLQNYPRLLNPGNNVVIMSVESPSPSYWRASALDSFTGTAWVTSQAFLQQIEGAPFGEPDANGRYAAYVYDIPASDSSPLGRGVTQTFRTQAVYTNYFFAGGDPQSLVIDLAIPLRMNDMRALRVNTALGPALAYSLDVIVPEIAPTDLVGLESDYPGYIDNYLALPFAHAADIEGPDGEATWRNRMEEADPDGWEWMDLYALNESIVRDATDPYQITLRIERYLRQFYTYSLTPPPSEYSSPYSAFLFDKRSGYCQHFAGAMALLLRYNGIPSRVAVGFTSGESQADGTYLVSTNNAHAWVEVYFPTVGWVAFNPTPGRSIPYAGASSTSPEFVNPFVDTRTPSGGSTPTLPPRDTLPGSQLNGSGTPESGGGGGLSRATWLPWVAAVILVIAGYPVVRSLWRRRRLYSGPLEGRLEASLGLLRVDLSDHGVPVSCSHTLGDTLLVVHAHLGIDSDQAFVERTEAILFGGRKAHASDVKRAEALRHLVRTRLRIRRGWLRRVMAWYGVSRFLRRSELQYRDDKTGRKIKETTHIHPRAL